MIKEDCEKSCYNKVNLENLKNSHILITGGTGFMGTWLTKMILFLNENYNFKIHLYILARNTSKNLTENELSKIYFIRSDIKNIKELPSQINYIIHAAGTPDSREHVSNPIKTIEIFYKGTQNILDQASRLPNLVKIIHLSSSKVYGINYSANKIPESGEYVAKINDKDIYIDSKRISEAICKAYTSELQLPIIIVRPFAFIGPFQSLEKPWAINNFIRDAILGGPVRILGNELTTKSYMYGSDFAYYMLSLLSCGTIGEVYNIGSSTPVTLVELANKIIKNINTEIEIKIKSSKDTYNDFSFEVPEMSKINNELNLKLAFEIDEALRRTIMWNNIKLSNV
jgi:nucleoside-diphosphate-sugar epimerase